MTVYSKKQQFLITHQKKRDLLKSLNKEIKSYFLPAKAKRVRLKLVPGNCKSLLGCCQNCQRQFPDSRTHCAKTDRSWP